MEVAGIQQKHMSYSQALYVLVKKDILENVFCVFWVFDAKENTSKATFGNHVCVCVYVFLFFFFSRVCETCGYCLCTVYEQQLQSLTFLSFFSQSMHTMHCLWIYKFHFLVTFSLKMGPTVLFTHLKIILLQYFSVFSF